MLLEEYAKEMFHAKSYSYVYNEYLQWKRRAEKSITLQLRPCLTREPAI